MTIAFWGDSLTSGIPGRGFFPLLKKELPDIRWLDYGKTGDTALSLYQRLLRKKPLPPTDMAFLWIGINETLVMVKPSFGTVKKLSGRSWCTSESQYKDIMASTISELSPTTERLVVVPPLLIGETPNPYNERLKKWNDTLQEITANCSNGVFLDLHEQFNRILASESSSDFHLHRALTVMTDSLFYRTDRAVSRLSKKRGLVLTMDGIHLNGRGCRIVCDAFKEEILRFNASH